MKHSSSNTLTNIFDYISPKFLLGNANTVVPDWGAVDCIYSFYKFYYFLDGEAILKMFDTTFYPKPGELYLIPSETKHSYSHNPKHPVYKYWCHFDLSINLNKIINYSKEIVVCTPNREIIIPVFDQLLTSNSNNSLLNILTRKSCLLQLLIIFFKNIDLSKIILEDNNEFYHIIYNYIQDNIDKPICVNELANLVHLQPNYFIYSFRQHFYASPIEYINTLRLDNAAQNLKFNLDLSIEQIAIKNGFSDYRYFGRAFKKRYGITPSQYRCANESTTTGLH